MIKNRNFLIYGAEQIVQVVSKREKYLRGGSESLKNLAILNKKQDTDLVLVSVDGLIKYVGYANDTEYEADFKNLNYDNKINATGCCILPGLIDSHTHPVWAGERINEFKMKVILNRKINLNENVRKVLKTVRRCYLYDDSPSRWGNTFLRREN